ncbi:MAG: ECF transporter S component [Bacillota bacterium]|jgi:thiamine transporter ThiT|nr:ECF transporter S component [Eubacteriales bacterium]MDI9492753.1 ECF transporter S component [Bacillota bacterium]NLV69499.1 ECF transporter S component [Clostridiales bacterium]MDD3536708.1 ECF transporter S component [Eubacteriales bacterium]MDD4285937.1 ECF transporter S component [Eubacteriales bacterium]
MQQKQSISNMILAGLFLALGLLLPFLTGQIQQFGNMILPMHIPVLLCGFVCGPLWGLAVGFTTPLLRSILFTMPPLFPMAAAMAFELAAYGLLSGALSKLFAKEKKGLYAVLIIAMLGGRVVWGMAARIFYGMAGIPFGWKVFLAGGFLNAWPGILVQLILIPPLVLAIRRITASNR